MCNVIGSDNGHRPPSVSLLGRFNVEHSLGVTDALRIIPSSHGAEQSDMHGWHKITIPFFLHENDFRSMRNPFIPIFIPHLRS